MDQNDKQQMVKIVCYGFGACIAYYIVIGLFRFVVAFLAILSVGYLLHQYHKNNRRW